VSERLGHSTTGITNDVYQHVIADLDRDTAARLSQIVFGTADANASASSR
jgi:hypothetical protein